MLNRAFLEQYEIDGQHRVKLLENEKISSSNVQSPGDPEASYRNRGNQEVKSYSVNVTETISDEVCLNLITDVDVRKANIADKSFVKATIEVTGQPVTTVYANGAYQSPSNDRKSIDMIYTGIRGALLRYEPELKRKKNNTHWACCRCMLLNLVRIVNFDMRTC